MTILTKPYAKNDNNKPHQLSFYCINIKIILIKQHTKNNATLFLAMVQGLLSI
ncbi:MAG: hypothetical protein ACJAU3_000815 [Zhongshania sp.]|jgi:hypothetical protein